MIFFYFLYLSQLLKRNGFWAFESALLVLPGPASEPSEYPVDLISWNSSSGWRLHYDELEESVLFFAMDLFANPYGIVGESISKLDSETGKLETHSRTLDEWAERILTDYNYETGWELGRDWQRLNGPLPSTARLLPRIPFVLGGEFEASNLVAIDLREAMAKLGKLYQAIRHMPDGSRVVTDWL